MKNWAAILSHTLDDALRKVKSTPEGTKPYLYTDSYLLDIICMANEFPGMGWSWNHECPPINVYYKNIWEHNCATCYGQIYDQLLIPVV